jgi:hypothetical protein
VRYGAFLCSEQSFFVHDSHAPGAGLKKGLVRSFPAFRKLVRKSKAWPIG